MINREHKWKQPVNPDECVHQRVTADIFYIYCRSCGTMAYLPQSWALRSFLIASATKDKWG